MSTLEQARQALIDCLPKVGEPEAQFCTVLTADLRAALAQPAAPAQTREALLARWGAPVGEKWCLFCNKAGHVTTECQSTHGLNTPAARELALLAEGANPQPAAPAQAVGRLWRGLTGTSCLLSAMTLPQP